MNFFKKLFGNEEKKPAPAARPAAPARAPNAGQPQKPSPPPNPPKAPPAQTPPASTDAKVWNVGDIILNDYKVVGMLGRGGMGVVYLVVRSQSTGEKFAVKKLLVGDDDTRRNFLMELQTWLDMPEYPHLVACRFFRTVGDELAIFAEYVEGGSLADWIRNGKLTRLDQILDVAIQFAWGLHAVHELGLVHQDVKPGNALLTPDGIVKVTDFGLARAKAVKEKNLAQDPSQSILVSSGGMTPAYCSPEQANMQPLSRKTDIWSWGISVLEMFVGEVTWSIGLAAPQVLEYYATHPASNPALPKMPAGVIGVLKKCFRSDPADRWPTLLHAAEALENVQKQVIRVAYPRQRISIPKKNISVAPLDHINGNISWVDPKEWLTVALKADGCDPNAADLLLAPPYKPTSRKAQAVADLAGYEEAKRIYERLISKGRKDLESQLANLCMNKALIHSFLNDFPGTDTAYDKVCEIWERIVNQENRHELAHELASAYNNKGLSLKIFCKHHEAAAQYDKAIKIFEHLVNSAKRQELSNDLSICYLNKANCLVALGETLTAVILYDRVIEIREQLVNLGGRHDLDNDLASCYICKGCITSEHGDKRAAVELYDKAIKIRERLVNQEGCSELDNDLAMAYMNQAIVMSALRDRNAAVTLYNKAIEIRERLVNQEGRSEVANNLAMAYMNKAIVISELDDNLAAVELCDKAIEIRERLINQEGRHELANDLAISYMNKASIISYLDDNKTAVILYDKAIQIWEPLVYQEGQHSLTNDLARAYYNKAIVLNDLGNNTAAVNLYDKAIEVWERLVTQEGRRELAENLAEAYKNRSILIGANDV